jgi:predicted Zn-dependent peptidase
MGDYILMRAGVLLCYTWDLEPSRETHQGLGEIRAENQWRPEATMKRPWFLIVIMLITMNLVPETYGATSADSKTFPLPAIEHTLSNGMRFLIVERHESPTFSALIRFQVGSVNDPPGMTGMAHLVEHMMFKGTALFGSTDPIREQPILERIDVLRAIQSGEQLPPVTDKLAPPERQVAIEQQLAALETQAQGFVIRNELWEIYRRNGGTNLNAVTFRDSTQYFVTLPKNRVELWAFMESDRFRQPIFREFYTERAVIQEEYRRNVETNPQGLIGSATLAKAFSAVPYGHPVWGWPKDLLRITRPIAEAFRETYYTPNNAFVVLVGDLNPTQVIPILDRYFGSLPIRPLPPTLDFREPLQDGERRVIVDFPAEPQLVVAYQAPPIGHPDTFPLSVLGTILATGRSARLQRHLVEEQRLLTRIVMDTSWFLQHAGTFLIHAIPRAPHSLEEAETAIQKEIDKISSEPVGPRELTKAQNQIVLSTNIQLASNSSLAAQLAKMWAYTGDWRTLFSDQERILSVTGKDIQDVARRYLQPERRTVGWLQRQADPSPPDVSTQSSGSSQLEAAQHRHRPIGYRP